MFILQNAADVSGAYQMIQMQKTFTIEELCGVMLYYHYTLNPHRKDKISHNDWEITMSKEGVLIEWEEEE